MVEGYKSQDLSFFSLRWKFVQQILMYISELRIWNFRKYTKEGGAIDTDSPHLVVPFSKGLNILVGENDSGKTAIVDAIKFVTKTHSLEWIRLTDSDFSFGCDKLRIEVVMKELSEADCNLFMELLNYNPETGEMNLVLVLEANRRDGRILPYEVKAYDGQLEGMNAEQKEYLKATYLRALRDADNELTAKKNSRTSQILLGHDLFKEGAAGKVQFESIFQEANQKIKDWFKDENGGENSNKSQIKDIIDRFIHAFLSENYSSELSISDPTIRSILEKVSIGFGGSGNLGLGSMNRLFMATELLHLKKSDGVKICLIEELEAHLHPQAQMKVVESLQSESDVQFIMTTHSPNLASKLKLDSETTSMILCKDVDVYPLRKGMTRLVDADYKYLDNFLDVTKSNLFFAKGIILVEGWAEELLLPALATNQGFPLSKHEVSIVNVGSTAYLHFARILMRSDGKQLNYPVSIVTDYDVRPKEDWSFDETKERAKLQSIEGKLNRGGCDNVSLFLATHWTLEWCLFNSDALSELFMECCMEVHSHTDEFQKGEDGHWNKDSFKQKLSDKLKNRTLDKVQIATLLSQKIKEMDSPIEISEVDMASYLIEAIKFVCK